MRLEDLTVEVRDINLVRVGVVRPEELDLRMEDRFNNVGSWKLTLAAEHPMVEHLKAPGAGIIVTGPNGVLLSGPTTKPEFAATPEDPMGSITFEGVTDTVILSDSLSWPQPSNSNVSTQTEAHDVRTGNAESLMHAYVNYNIGPGASVARKNANLTMGTNGNRGPTLTKRPRFPVLGNLLTDIALRADLGFRVIQVDDALEFQTYAITDRSAYIRLDVENDTLAGSRLAVSAPTATRVIVAGQNEGVERKFREVTTSDSIDAEADWGRRIERFLDQRNTNVDAELDSAGLEVLAEEGFTAVAVQAVPVDDSEGSMRYGIDWGLGDLVTVVIGTVEYTSTVTGTLFQVSPDGFKVGVVLGDGTKFDSSAALSGRVTDTARRVGELERNMESTADLAAEFEDHLADTTDAHDASAISFAPTGTVAATNVQAAIAEVATEYAAADSALNTRVTTLEATPTQRVTGLDAGANTVLNGNQLYARSGVTANQSLYLNHASSGNVYLGQGGGVKIGSSGAVAGVSDQVQSVSGYLRLNWETSNPVAVGGSGTTTLIQTNAQVVGNLYTSNGAGCAIGGGLTTQAGSQIGSVLILASTDVNVTGAPQSTTGTRADWVNTSGSNWRLTRTASSRRYKEQIKDLDSFTTEQILSLRPRLYKRNDQMRDVPVPSTSELDEDNYVSVPVPVEESPWFAGFIAEEADELGLTTFVFRNAQGQVDSFRYDEFAAIAHQYVLRAQQERIVELTLRLELLEQAFTNLGAVLPDLGDILNNLLGGNSS